MMQLGIIRPSCSNWTSRLLLVSKGNGVFRGCGDYCALNSITNLIYIQSRIPVILPLLSRVNQFFPKIDLIRAYNQLPVEPADIPKTPITTLVLSEFWRLLFGLRNAGQTFQRFIDHVLHGLDFVCAYIDDVLVASSSAEDLSLLRMIFERFEKYGIVIKPIKCEFGKAEVTFSGHE